MLKLILLDRDGVLNRELGGYVTCPENFEVPAQDLALIPVVIRLF